MSYLWQRICCVFEKCYIRRHIKLYTCYVVTKEMLYMWQRICPVLDKCYIRGHKWHLFGCRSICRVEGDNFDNFHPFVFDNHHHCLSSTIIIIVQYRPTKRVTIHAWWYRFNCASENVEENRGRWIKENCTIYNLAAFCL